MDSINPIYHLARVSALSELAMELHLATRTFVVDNFIAGVRRVVNNLSIN